MTRYEIIASIALAVSALSGVTDLAGQVATQTALGGPAPTPHPVHETTRGAFIDPLITEHAFVDRKVRSDFIARLAREDEEGESYMNEFIFEYAFTRWFSVEMVQPFLITDPREGSSHSGPGDIQIAAKFQLTRAADTGGLILGTGLEFKLPSGETDVGFGEEYVIAPLAALDWAIGSGRVKLQSQSELEIAFARDGGAGELEALEWNTALSFFASDFVVPLLELNTEFEGLEQDTESIFALTPGVVISLKDIAGTSFDIAAGAQLFFGSDREEDVVFLVSLRHHWPLPQLTGLTEGSRPR